ncbi:MAG: hypothetical protein ACJA0B_000163 [Alcanivorax borkumensis]|jgi:hypothetical protein
MLVMFPESGMSVGRKVSRLIIVTGLMALITACATSMSPAQFGENFPRATTSKHYSKPSAEAAVSDGKCHIMVKDRKYVAPIGLTVHGDVKNGAVGVDEWVAADKANAYTINNYEWISVPIGEDYATQLILYFDTLQCT